jgi:phenylacetate-CoA ligase
MQSGGRVLKGSSAHLNQRTLPDYHKALQDFAPGILWAYPSVLELLLSCLEQRDLTLDIPIVLTSSEVLTSDVRARAEKRLNATVIDYYGQAERVCFASDPDGAGYRFLGPYGAVELMATEDPQRKEIVATNLRNNAMILLRYRTGDIAVLDAQPTREHLEEIALGLRPFGRIDGREGDYLLAPDGSRIIGMNHVPRGIEGVLQMQIHQTSASDVAVHAIAGTTDTASLRTAIETAMRPRMPADMTLTVAFRDRLTRTSAGKLPFIVRTIGSSDN